MTWRERIVAARESGEFTEEDRILASSWQTCAVHEQHEAHPDVVVVKDPGMFFEPVDTTLYALGSEAGFSGAVLTNQIDVAERTLDAIEDRVLTLKREQIV